MGYPVRELPELQHSDLRPFLPAIRHATRLVREEAERLEARVEVHELQLLGRTREDLQQLCAMIKEGTGT